MVVNTVTGVAVAGRVGKTLFHEHFIVGPPGRELVDTAFFNVEEVVDAALIALSGLKPYGIETIIDPCPIDLGRNVELLRIISERSGVNIICATGLYNQRLGLPTFFKSQSEDWMTELFVREITHGIRESDIRAGVIKCATSGDRIRSHERKVLVAAARAQRSTGVPIITHTDEGRHGLEQANILIDEGVDPTRIVIGHSCQITDIAYANAILETGVFLGIDRIGMMWAHPDEQRLALLSQLIAIGFEEQILISQDYALRSAWDSSADFVPSSHAWRRDEGFSYLFTKFIPLAERAGLSRRVFERMLYDNVNRLFGIEPSEGK